MYPKFRVLGLLNKLGVPTRQHAGSEEEEEGQYRTGQLPSLADEDTQVLWSPYWGKNAQELEKHDDQYYRQWIAVWNRRDKYTLAFSKTSNNK